MSAPIGFETVAARPLPGCAVPSQLRFAPDDSVVTYLFSPDESLHQQLYAFDPKTSLARRIGAPPGGGDTEEQLLPEEQLRRERTRTVALGVTRYAWASRSPRLLLPIRGDLYVQDGLDAPLRLLLAGGAQPLADPQFSPDGENIAFARDGELWVVPSAGGTPRQLSSGPRAAGVQRGLAEFVAQEEMGRQRGLWWSRDGRWLAYTEVDERHIPAFRILHLGKDAVGEGAQEDHRYPFAGGANAAVRLGVVPVAGGQTRWLELGGAEYLARAEWIPDGRLAVQTQNREQTQLELALFDPHDGARELVLREQSDVWINLGELFRPLGPAAGEAAGGFIWGSERSGFAHLYLYGAGGRLIRALTSGEWLVSALVGVDEARAAVYFVGTREDPRERQLYETSFAGGEPRRITQRPGTHAVSLDHAGRRFVDLHSSLEEPPRVSLHSLEDGAELALLHESPPRPAELVPPRLVSLTAHDGTRLYGALYEPAGPGPHRSLVSVYGGPRAQRVTNSWEAMTADLRAQLLRSRGFLVFKLDNRGSANRGLAFEGAVRHDLGNLEVQDQVDGVRWLVAQGLADPARVGIYGGSYGGYMAAMSLARAPDCFALAVASAPVTHWDGYDTHYTERYMSTPQRNPGGYRDSSVMHHVGSLRGALLLVHGLLDENVHFRHSARLIEALTRARAPYELLLLPSGRHSTRRFEDRLYVEERIFRFIDTHL